jgi:hypothetical protein
MSGISQFDLIRKLGNANQNRGARREKIFHSVGST